VSPKRKSVQLPFITIPEALDEIRQGRMIVVVDDEDRENEGDLTIAAEKITPDAINFMARYGRGLICLAMTGERLDDLQIPMQVSENTAKYETAFCVSIEAKRDVTTGISAQDRATTIRTAIDPATKPYDLARPGHVFPLRARKGGVLRRAGQTEAAVDLAKLAGLYPAGVICEIMNDDGTMARIPQLTKFCKKHRIRMITIADLIQYRMSNERLVRKVADTRLPTRFGEFFVKAYESNLDDAVHLAIVCGDIQPSNAVLVRVHSQCLTGDIFHSWRCDCGQQLEKALEMIQQEGKGVLLYLHGDKFEGRGIGLVNKLKAYELQDHGEDTVEANETLGFKADQRDYGIGAQILRELGVQKMKLMTNNPSKYVGLKGYGLEIVERISIEIEPTGNNLKYLRTKKEKMGHLLSGV
jgi:3,4-dihydroxy 2-butanone 4-phosphate synthase/GTP cyclohydrolase II